MHLKRIEISGFKSFAQKTTLEFDKEISAIVGPNGSGKSNVADAVRWAIGEQSIKNLRVKKSENLIFSGHTQGAGKAGVSLFFDNLDHKLPIDFDEIEISRRLYKSGENEYFINGSKARLLDILELLSRVGINPKSYCVVSQGMADAILRASSEERRSIFEDAAGVKPYKIKRGETLRKLDLAEQNLFRVRDLLAEISPRLSFLKRQANKAQKLSVVKSQLENILKTWYSFNLNRLYRQKNEVYAKKDKIDKIFAQSQDKLGKALEEMNQIKASSGSLDVKQENLRETLENVQNKIDECIKNLAISETRLKIEEEKMEQSGEEAVDISIDYIREKISEIHHAIGAIVSATRHPAKNAGSGAENEKNISELEKRVGELLEEIDTGKVPIDKKISEKRKVEKEKILKYFLSEIAEHKAELGKFYQERDAARKQISEGATDDKTRRSEFFSLQEEINKAEEAANKLRDEKQEIVIEDTKISTRIEDLVSEVKTELSGISVDEILKLKVAEIDETETEAQINKFKREYIQIGGIDPAVIDEYKETEERHNFLAKESEDLDKAVLDLRKVINQLDEKIEEQFDSVFKKINFEFNKYFRTIFGGGGAALELFETKKTGNEGESGESPEGEEAEKNKKIEKGINVKVNIPGKKIKDLEMLSGGERSLTSSAILFAIISSNPPPFVVLDEIDAALDETNSQKIAEIIKQIGGETQFIVITHNRAMMRQAKTIYGVSMTDESVSKVISVKFDEMK